MSGLNTTSTIPFSTFIPPLTLQNDTELQNTAVDAETISRLPPTTHFGPQVNFTIWLLTALSAAFLALRVYCKFLRHRGLWWDDYLLIASWVSASVPI
jgi:hypothetical protein